MKKMFCLCSTLVAAVSAWGAGTEDALWRPQGADATWNSAAWQTSLGITAFVPGWSATFDGAEQNYIGTICNLEEPITKTDTQSLKITYSITDA